MSEQLALDQLTRNRGDVDRDERLRGAGPEIVDRARNEFLAGARFAEDEYGQVGRHDPRDGAINLLHRR